MNQPAVVAAVMTYNRKEMLRRCVQAIRAQTTPPSMILVLDNASTDGTARMLADEFPEVTVLPMSENLGCAGAMRELLQYARTLPADYIWFFDDDVIPEPQALERLYDEMRLLERERRVGVLRPMVRDPHSGVVGGGGISHASLLRQEMVRSVALPPAELFIELSDHSYNRLIRQAGFEILRLPIVLAQHPINRPKALREIINRGYHVKPWRLYYAIRNRVYFSLYVERSGRRLARQLAVAAGSILLLTAFGRPRRGQTLVIRGVLDGMLARLGRRIDPAY